MTSAVELGSEAWFFAATNGNPPLWDWLFFNELSTDVACGNLPHAASPCTACDVSFVSGPVKVFGLAAGAAAVRLIQSMLYKTQALDPPVYVAVAATLLMVAVLACLVPAWRASRLDPTQALRSE